MVTANNAVSEDDVRQMAQDAGFKEIQIKEEIEHHDFKDVNELARFFGTFLSGYKDIGALSAETRQELIQTVAKIWVDTVGTSSYMWANLVVRGKKPNLFNQTNDI